jgi:hypothetical protein
MGGLQEYRFMVTRMQEATGSIRNLSSCERAIHAFDRLRLSVTMSDKLQSRKDFLAIAISEPVDHHCVMVLDRRMRMKMTLSG